MLAVLLLDIGRAVPLELLIDRVWGEQPPASVRNALYGYLARLRKVITAAGEPQVQLTRSPVGYLLRAPAEQLDLHRFRTLAAAPAHARDDRRIAAQLQEALELWHGQALAGLDSPWLRGMRETLELERAAAALELNEVRLRLGEHAALVSELSGQAAAAPRDERLVGQLMLALYRCGRQAEALGWFEKTRQHLSGELGTDPGPRLRSLHQQILRADPSLAAPAPAGEGTARIATRPVPRQLPPDVSAFTGRAAELARLDQLIGSGEATVAVISAVSGTAGVGKTALVLHWAHQAADRFPDGQLFLNLRGYDPDRPMPAADALAGFLRALGVRGQEIPAEEDERAATYRSLLAGKQVLVVLDNARSVEQVRPLLPGSASCAVVVTSRDALVGLVVRDGATRLEVDPLPSAEAVGLLRALVGSRVEDDPGAAALLADQCCRLPLALRVAAELAATRPDVPLAELAGELADESRRLDLLDAGGDPRTAVRAVFSWSYGYLDPGTARAFRLAGLHPGPDFEAYATAALTGMTPQQACTLLDILTRAHLIQPAAPGRYGMHDLLRSYARELANADDGEEGQDAALTRLFDHYLHTASIAMDALHPAERDRRPRVPASAHPVPPVTEPTAARAWLDAERATLAAATGHAAGHGWPSHATRLAATLFRYLDQGGHYPEAITIYGHARAAAQRAGDRGAEAAALNQLAGVHWQQGRYQQAIHHLQQALPLFGQVGDRMGAARALSNLGQIRHSLGCYQEAIGLYRQALAIFRETGDPFGNVFTLNNLGISEERQGRYDLAARHHRQALAIADETGVSLIECVTRINLGTVVLRQGRFQQAAGHLDRALALSREIGYREAQAEALGRIGDLRLRQGCPEEAVRHLQDALSVYRELEIRSGEADALNSLAEVLLATGKPDHARAEFAAALRLAAQTHDKYQQARAHHGLGKACCADSDPGEAGGHWQEALALFTELGTPEADQVRAQLAAEPAAG